MVKTFFYPDQNVLSQNAAKKFFEDLKVLANSEDQIFVALSGGRSLLGFYWWVAQTTDVLPRTIWQKVRFCFADERVVPFEDKDSNYGQLKKPLFDRLLQKKCISHNQILLPDFEKKELTQNYSSQIPRLDICLLGSGEDGHIASLFPNHNSCCDKTLGYIEVVDSPKPPPRRISVSGKMIKEALNSYIFFVGKTKSEAFKNFLDENIEVIQSPNKLARFSQRCLVFTDIKV